MEFPHWPSALVFFLVYLVFFLWHFKHKGGAALLVPDLGGLVKGSVSPRVMAANLLPWLRLVCVALIAVALSQPRVGETAVTTEQEGVAILMIMDRSSSMLDPMVFRGQETERLEVVKKVFEEFVLGDGSQLKGRPGDRIGLITFAGFAEEISPLTLDHQSLVHFARTVQVAQRFEDGTMIGDALEQATLRMIAYQGLLKRQGHDQLDLRSKVMILLTDGQQSQGGVDPLEAAQMAKQNGIRLYSIAIVGNQRSAFGGLGSFFRLNNPFLDTSLIEEAARMTGGGFFKADTGESLVQVYQKIDELEKTKFEEKRVVYKERFASFLVPALVLLLLELALSWGPLRKLP
ncbi:MAG: VWA domain-containing protein [bacterium]|nr:VWA domain-containing protein [bacterium]